MPGAIRWESGWEQEVYMVPRRREKEAGILEELEQLQGIHLWLELRTVYLHLGMGERELLVSRSGLEFHMR
jgi:hypothetical protein